MISFPDELYYDEQERPSARIPEIKNVLLDPLSCAFARFPSELRRFFFVKPAENVFRDLFFSHQFPKQAIRSQPNLNQGTWLTYPIANHEKLVRDHMPETQETRVDITPGAWISYPVDRDMSFASSCEQNGSCYFVEQGERSNLVWEDDGESFLRGQWETKSRPLNI